MKQKIAIVVPLYNAGEGLTEKVLEINRFIQSRPYSNFYHQDIILAENNSTDNTPLNAERLAFLHDNIIYYPVPEQGKGSAVKRTWLAHDYDIYSFMDQDLATDLTGFPKLINAIEQGYDIAIGSRYAPGSEAKRSPKREKISKTYRFLFNLLFKSEVKDPQCGFKAITREIRDNILPYVKSDDFFFDTELLIKAFYAGYKIQEVPVTWNEDPNSTMKFRRDIPPFLLGLARIKYEQLTGRFPKHK